MKRHLLITAIALVIISGFTGCRKWVNEEKRIEGRWRLAGIERINFLSWRSVQNDYRDGTFIFFNNGSASYDDFFGTMNGSWRMRESGNGYYDNDGDWRTDSQVSLMIDLFNFQNNRVLTLDFDQVIFRGRDRFLAEYHSPNYRYRYDFRRE